MLSANAHCARFELGGGAWRTITEHLRTARTVEWSRFQAGKFRLPLLNQFDKKPGFSAIRALLADWLLAPKQGLPTPLLGGQS